MSLRPSIGAALVAALLVGAPAVAGAPIVHAAATGAVAPPAAGAGDGPAGESSIGFLFGVGWYDNTDFNADLVNAGVPAIENGFEYGLQYRRRVSRWFSIGAELGRMDGRTNPTDGSNIEYAIAATPLHFEVFAHPVAVGNASLSLFGGGGPLIATRLSQSLPNGAVIAGTKTGFGAVAGLEGEARFGPNVGFFLRGLVRRAKTKQIEVDDGTGGGSPVVYDVDFDGLAVTFGPRWYFGGD